MMLKKDITFIYMDEAERLIYLPIAQEAEQRGYRVKFTKNKFERCEIGFYCQHVNFPQYSRFSIIMLHDIIQQYGNWPDIWLREPWNKYDIGFLPSNQWVDNWNQCSQYYYTNPRIGMFKAGWTKADKYANVDRKKYKTEFNKIHQLSDNKKTILYAPSWENDGKQNDFVQSMLKLNVNILIKQASVDPGMFPDMYAAIKEMQELHKDIPEVTILDPKTNIFEAIMACDVLVSEESSTMCEAVMMGIPAVSVSNWLIPDVTPKRFPSCAYDFVYMTTKEDLSNFVKEILDDYDAKLVEVNRFREKAFGKIGGNAQLIMDILDDCVNEKDIRYNALSPKNAESLSFRRWFYHVTNNLRREISGNYAKNNYVVGFFWNILRVIKHSIS